MNKEQQESYERIVGDHEAREIGRAHLKQQGNNNPTPEEEALIGSMLKLRGPMSTKEILESIKAEYGEGVIPKITDRAYGLKKQRGYRNFIKNLDTKIWNWRYAFPIGVVAVIISSMLRPLGGTWNVIGDAVGIFNLLIIVGIFSVIGEIVQFFRKKNSVSSTNKP